uniref:Uncharacterized protein n=1 Tax=Rhizophora mucronata TaxID=61149 RepID=A0A2P2K6B3_RHIMU
METIMTLVIEESEDLSLDLLTLLLVSVRKESQSVSSIAWKLGEKVVTNCAAKLKPYLKEAVQSLGIPLDEYAPIVVSIIQDNSNALEDNQVNDSGEHMVNRGSTTDDAYPGELSQGVDDVPSLTRGIGSALMENAKAITIHSSPKLLERCSFIQRSKGTNARGNTEIEVKLSKEPEIVQKKRGQQHSSLMNPEEGHNHPWINRGRKIVKQSHEAHVSVTEPVAIKQRTPAVVGPSSSTPRKGLSDGSLPKRSQPRKKEAIVDDPSSLSSPRGEILSAQFGQKAPESDDLGLGRQSKERKNSEPHERKPPRKTGGVKKNVEMKSMTHGCGEIEKNHEAKNPLCQSIVVGVKSNDKDSIVAQKDNRKQNLMVGAVEDEDMTEASDNKVSNECESHPSWDPTGFKFCNAANLWFSHLFLSNIQKTKLSGRDRSQPRKTPKKTVKRTHALRKEVVPIISSLYVF